MIIQKVIASSKLPDEVVNAIKTILLSNTISLNAATNKSHSDKQHSKELNDKNLLSETTSCEDSLRFFMPIFDTNRSNDLEKTWISIAMNLGSAKNIHGVLNSLFI